MKRLRSRIGGLTGIALIAALSCSMGVSASPVGESRGDSDSFAADTTDTAEAAARADSMAVEERFAADSTAAGARAETDSTAALIPAPADSAVVPSPRPLWTVEDLDSVLTRESGADVPEGLYWKRKKNARVAMLCALLFPGLGQIYNEKPYKAALVMGVQTFYLGNVLLNYRYAEREEYLRSISVPGTKEWRDHDVMVVQYKETMIDWIWWSAGAMLIIVLDAYVDAHLHDMNFEVEGRAIEGGAGISLGFIF